MQRADVVVVGGGIVGLATARAILRRDPARSVVVLEKESAVGTHQSGRNSGVIHAGVYYRPGSEKARLCTAGRTSMVEYCRERGIEHAVPGKVVVATDETDRARLVELVHRCEANGVRAELIGPERLREIEPHAAGIAALHSPNTGVVDFPTVAASLASEVRSAGGRVITGCEVLGLEPGGSGSGDQIAVTHLGGTLDAGKAVLCAGPWADRLAVLAGADPDPRIVPFRGAYLRLRPGREELVRSNIYPVPTRTCPFSGCT